MHFSKEDELDLSNRGITLQHLMQQIHQFTKEIRPVKLERPCTPGDGLLALSGSECHRLQKLFETSKDGFSQIKFVPASGAATRMFKHLHNYSEDDIPELTEEFIVNFDRFPFLTELNVAMASKGFSLEECLQKNEWVRIFDFILKPDGLNYDSQLKGLVIFHKYPVGGRTAFEEHVNEALFYVKQNDGRCRIHFTLAPQHVDMVRDFLNEKVKSYIYENIEISISVQAVNTDTIALNKEDEPVRDDQGKLFFRPSGHGALIHNLEQLDADIIYIKNIDNISSQGQLEETIFYKQVIAGLLIELKTESVRLLNELDAGNTSVLEEALEFIQGWFQPGLPLGMTEQQLKQYAQLRLDRPMRICGMVRNEGEPGGGPFWVKMNGGYLSKQIVERSQVDQQDVLQSKILASSTHFNPVDIVCSIRKRNGENYHLDEFIDYSAGFISEKFHHGNVIKALEWPGLWNGAMALWNTVFVEVPISTFNPVKTVNDLLRPGHQ